MRAMLRVPSVLLLALLCLPLLTIVTRPATAAVVTTAASAASGPRRSGSDSTRAQIRPARPRLGPAAPARPATLERAPRLTCSNASADLFPCTGGSATTLVTSTSGQRVQFTLTNMREDVDQRFSFGCSVTGPLTGCTTPEAIDLPAGWTTVVTVLVNTSSTEGTGSVHLSAHSAFTTVTGTRTVVVQAPAPVLVTTSPTSGAVDAGGSGSHGFTVKNTGGVPANYSLTTPCTGEVVSCHPSSTLVHLSGGATTSVTVDYDGDRPGGTGTVALRATNTLASAKTSAAAAAISVRTVAVSVTASPSTLEAGTASSGTATFTVHNTGTSDATFGITATCAVGGSTCQRSATSVTLANNASTTVTVHFDTGPTERTESVTLHATYGPYPEFTGSGAAQVTLVAPCSTVAASLTPCTGGTPTMILTGVSGQSVHFTLTNMNENASQQYTFSCTRTVPLTDCTAPGLLEFAPGETRFVEVPVSLGSTTGPGSVRLVVTGPAGQVAGVRAVDVKAPAPVLVTTTSSGAVDAGGSGSHSFKVKNTGNHGASYSLTTTCSGEIVSCDPSTTLVSLNSGAMTTVTVAYDGDRPGGTGTVSVRATNILAPTKTSLAAATISVRSVAVTVAPTASSVEATGGSTGSASFTVHNAGASDATFALAASCGVGLSNCQASPGFVTLANGASATVTASFHTASTETTSAVTLHATYEPYPEFAGSGSAQVTIVAPCVGARSQLSPCTGGTATTLATGDDDTSIPFTLANNSATDELHYTFSCSVTGALAACTVPDAIDVAARFAAVVDVPVTAGSTEGAGTVRLVATSQMDQVAGVHDVAVQVPSPVLVTVVASATHVDAGQSGTQRFAVQNTGMHSARYTVTTSCAGEIACNEPTASILLNQGVADTITVDYDGHRPGGSGTITVHAENTADVTVTGQSAVSIDVNTVAVTVVALADSLQVSADSAGRATFRLRNTGTSDAAFTLAATCTVGGPLCQPDSSVVTLANGDSATVTVAFGTGATEATGTVALTATYAPYPEFTGSASVPVHVLARCTGPSSTLVCSTESIVLLTSTDGQAVHFTLTNGNDTQPASYTFACSVTGVLLPCTPPADTTIPAGLTADVTVRIDAGSSEGLASVRLVATGPTDQVAATKHAEVLAVTSVVASTASSLVRVDAGDSLTLPFLVHNAGSLEATYALSPGCPTDAAQPCWLDAAQVTIATGRTDTIFVHYVSGAAGATGTVALTATHEKNSAITSTATTNLIVNTRGVVVTADADSVAVTAGVPAQPVGFMVRNTGYAGSFALTTPCLGAITGCAASDTVVTLDSAAVAHVTVTYTAAVASIAAGAVRLRATAVAVPAITAVGATRVAAHTAAVGGEPEVALVNSDSLSARGLCLTISAGAGAAYECGDLRLVHALPSVRTMNTTRTPVLLYDSRFAEPHPLVAVNVRLLPDTVAPDSVVATLTLDGELPGITARWSGAGWVPGTTRRLVIPVDNATLATGVHDYQLQVFNRYPGVQRPSAVVDGQLVVVNRRASPFGRGWWLAGLEQLAIPATDTTARLWVGGDGSVRRYVKVASGVWAAPAVTRPDTLTRDGTYYTRHLAHGLRVVFDATGHHVATINRLSDTTAFTYDGSGRLQTIVVPPGGTGQTYTVDYATPGQVAITTPPMGDTARVTTLLLTSDSLVTAIRDPDYQFAPNPEVAFGYDGPSARIDAVTDKMGVTTAYTYDAGGQTLAAVRRPLNAADTATVTIAAAERAGLAPAVVLADSVATLLDGPRLDVMDTTRFWLGRFGAPSQIHDALGHQTLVTRADPTYPALVTRIANATDRVLRATYDARGNVSTVMDSAAFGDARSPTTHYAWDPVWDAVTQITQPEGQVTTLAYDSTTGNRLWQQDGRGPTSRVTFTYYPTTDATAPGLLHTVERPGGASTTVAYDTRGNLASVQSARGFTTHYENDALGNPVVIRHPIGLSGDSTQNDSLSYDVQGRLVRHVSYGPAANGAPSQQVVVETFYGATGLPDSVSRSTVPATTIGVMTTRWHHDLAGRSVAELAPDGAVDSMRYDVAGNLVWHQTRRGDTLTMVYDPLNRLVKRRIPAVAYAALNAGIPDRRPDQDYNLGVNQPYRAYTIPADSARFAYDAVGHLVQADNGAAWVHRSYYPNGFLHVDSLYIHTLRDSASGGDFATHAYGLTYRYTSNGQVDTLTHPAQLAPVIGGIVRDATTYGYDPVTGWLARVTDVAGNAFAYHYNARGELESLSLPANYTESFGYDLDGRWTSDLVTSQASGALRQTVLHYDAAGKMYRTENGTGALDTLTARYAGLGYLLQSELVSHPRNLLGDTLTYHADEAFTYDPLANLTHTQSQTADPFGVTTIRPVANAYTAQTGRLAQVVWSGGLRTDTVQYNPAGDVEFFTQPSHSPDSELEDRRSYYAADGALRAADYRAVSDLDGTGLLSDFTAVFEEYRYDALGRRVVVWSRQWCQMWNRPEAPCRVSFVRRTVWAGARELYEIQMPGTDSTAVGTLENDEAPVLAGAPDGLDLNPYFGRVAYTYGPGVDQPLSVTRINYTDGLGAAQMTWPVFTLVPLWNARGQADGGYFAASGDAQYCWQGDQAHCVLLTWPAAWSAYGLSPTSRPHDYWHGTLLEQKRDKTGTIYRRARTYDPATGRFTQEDPIGLAGGLNLYGFAAGDPVNYLAVKTCYTSGTSQQTYWQATAGAAKLDSVPVRIRYGVAPNGFETAVKPKPLVAGCYEATASGKGVSASVQFDVHADGTVVERQRSAST